MFLFGLKSLRAQVAASLALAQEAARGDVTEDRLREMGAALRASRPTAVNL